MTSTRALRRGRFELLEQRQLLAGDVLVNVVDGILMVRGDALDNKIMIAAGAEAGDFVVTGLDGTTVHEDGQTPGAEVTVTGVHSAKVGLGAGNDLVAVVGANVRGHLAIRTGAGDDRVLIGTGGDAPELVGVLPADVAVNVRGLLSIDTNGDHDRVAVDDASIGRLAINAGVGNDDVSLGSTAAVDESGARLRVHRGIHVNLGDGNDELNMDQLRVRGGIIALGGPGDDTLNATSTRSHALAVLGGGGMDSVSLTHIDAHHLGIHTGDDSDSVDVRDSVFTSFGVSLGDGNDTLTTAALQARFAVMLGGDGEDTLDVISQNDFAHEVVHGFEIPPDVNVNDLLFGRRPIRRLLGLLP